MCEKYFIKPEEFILVITDIQEKLINAMKKDIAEKVIKNTITLIELSKLFNIPIILTEQYPKGLGQTVEKIRKALFYYEPIEKITFSSFLEPKFAESIQRLNRTKVIITGMETHVCVWQTSLDLLLNGYTVFVTKDAVCSRKKLDWKTGLELIKSAGGIITTTEILVFQILKKAGTEEFKKIIKLVK